MAEPLHPFSAVKDLYLTYPRELHQISYELYERPSEKV